MNERIQALLKQATRELNPDDRVWVFSEVDQAKFAELIVRECEKVAKDGPWYDDDPSCDWRKPINFVCNEMKEHFGIEQ